MRDSGLYSLHWLQNSSSGNGNLVVLMGFDFRFVACDLRGLAHCLICSSVIENHFCVLQLGSV